MIDDEVITLDDARGQLKELTILSRQFERAIIAAFKNGGTQAKSFETQIRSAALAMSTTLLRGALKPFFNGLGDVSKSLFGNMFGGGESSASVSDVTGFAQGGVFTSPRYFPTGNGLGVLGEAGPEAIMPLMRGPDGRLGVATSGSRDGNIVVHIATPDAPSFLRSEAQVTAALARAVARGRRGL
jgi:phage-related minor tail protein